MKYGTPTRLKYIVPNVRKSQSISPQAQMRLNWMDYINKGNNIAKCSRHFDIAESTIRYWYARFDPNNLSSLENRSKRPKNVRKCEVPFKDIERVVELRQKYRWGKVKLQKILKKEVTHKYRLYDACKIYKILLRKHR